MSSCNIRMSNPELFESLNLMSKDVSNSYYTKMVLASLIASFALAGNSQEGVIGSMLVSSYSLPILAIVANLAVGGSISPGITGLIMGFVIMVLVGAGVGMLFKDDEPTEEMKRRYVAPDKWTFISALIIGTGFGLVSLSNGGNIVESTGLGVAVSLLPPCANIGLTMVKDKIPEEKRKEMMKNTGMIAGVNVLGIMVSCYILYTVGCKYESFTF